ncbi:MAG: hypothetical protein VW879_04130, partial [Opitutae bacterium]
MKTTSTYKLSFTVFAVTLATALAMGTELPKPDGKPADMTKPVQVYVLMGQSNMLNFGNLKKLTAVVRDKQKYQYLVDHKGNWLARRDV